MLKHKIKPWFFFLDAGTPPVFIQHSANIDWTPSMYQALF